MEPEISIVMPTYNSEGTIKRVLEAIFNVDYALEKVELIIIDGCSTDNTHKIVIEMRQKSPLSDLAFVRVKSNIPEARDEGVKLARGNYICFIDSDVVIPRDFFKRLMPYFEKTTVGGVAGYSIYASDSFIGYLHHHKKGMGTNYFVGKIIEDASFLGCMCTIYRTCLIKDLHLNPNLVRGEDAEISIFVREKGYKLVLDGSVLCKHIKELTVKRAIIDYFNDGRGRAHLLFEHGKTEEHLLKSTFRYMIHLAIPASFIFPFFSIFVPNSALLTWFPLIIFSLFCLYLSSTFSGFKQKIVYTIPNVLLNLALSLGVLYASIRKIFGGQ